MDWRFDRDRALSFSRFLWQRFIDDKCFETAGALSYTTLISLVPLMVAVLAMISAFPVFDTARAELLDFIFLNLMPAAGAKVQEVLRTFAANASQLTGISILVMLFSALSMMISIEDRLNRIWRVHQARSWGSRLLLYWAALSLGPILAAGGIAITSYVMAMPLLERYQQLGMGQRMLSVLPFVVTFFTLWLMYAVIPNCKVRRNQAAIGALLGAVLFEVARWSFSLFVANAQSYQKIYGVLATIPIFLLWVYLSWVIVILGASVAASLSAYEYHPPTETLAEGAEFLGLLVVLRHFIEAHRSGDTLDPATVRLCEPYLRSASISAYFDDLQRADLIQRGEAGGWLLSRSLDSTDLLRVYRHAGYRLPLDPVREVRELGIELPDALVELLGALAQALREALGARLDQAFPALPPPPPHTEEISA